MCLAAWAAAAAESDARCTDDFRGCVNGAADGVRRGGLRVRAATNAHRDTLPARQKRKRRRGEQQTRPPPATRHSTKASDAKVGRQQRARARAAPSARVTTAPAPAPNTGSSAGSGSSSSSSSSQRQHHSSNRRQTRSRQGVAARDRTQTAAQCRRFHQPRAGCCLPGLHAAARHTAAWGACSPSTVRMPPDAHAGATALLHDWRPSLPRTGLASVFLPHRLGLGLGQASELSHPKENTEASERYVQL